MSGSNNESCKAVLTSEVETSNIVNISVLDQLPDFGLLQVVHIIVVGGAKVGAQAAVVAGDDGTTAASLLLGVNAVLDAEARSFDGIVKNSGVLVITSAAEVDDAVGRQDVLRSTGRVLGSAASNQLGVVVVEQVLIQRNVLLLGEDGIVGLEVILVKQSLITLSLDICCVHSRCGEQMLSSIVL